MWTLRGPLRWCWRDLPIRQKGLVVIAAPIVPLLATTFLLNLALVREERASMDAGEARRLRTQLQSAVTAIGETDKGALDATEAKRERGRQIGGAQAAMAALFDLQDRRLTQRATAEARVRRITEWFTSAGALLGLLGGLAGTLVFTRDIAHGIERLQINVDRLLTGEPLLPVHPGDDELKRAKRRLVDVGTERARRDQSLRAHAEQVDAANRELEAFSYSVSHDLRAPLRHVVGFSSLLEQHAAGSLDDTGRRYVHVIREAASRMGALIDDLLSFSRMGRSEMIHTDVDLNALVSDVLVEAGNFAPSREVTWTIHPLPRVRGDRAMLRVALVNLISNALKYTGPRPQPEIEIGARTGEGGSVIVYVKDNGVGFDMTYADKLFGVFQRLHTSDQFEGTGIGLANVRRIVQRHGGRTWAEGKLDAGATFYVSLPAA
jgi:signal transduction histidine kinase